MKVHSKKHTPFADGKFVGLADSFKNSPYPLHYTLRWPWFFRKPSLKNHSKILAKPDNFTAIHGFSKNDIKTTKILFAGDIMVLNGDQPPVLSKEVANLIDQADIFVANLEAPVGDHPKDPEKRYTFRFHMPRDFLQGITNQTTLDLSKWILTNANNHSGDAGIEGFKKSIDILSELGINHLGYKDNEGPIKSISVNGVKLGLAGWTHWLNRDMATNNQPVLESNDILKADIQTIKNDLKLDYLIGLPHWEYEFQHYPRNKTRSLGSMYIDKGFDLLLGSHPHVLQPYEFFSGKPCFYSLGNFCGLGIAKPVKIITLLELEIFKHKSKTETGVNNFKFHYFYQLHTEKDISIVPIDHIDEELQEAARSRIHKVMETNF